jgi:phosphatidylglycerol---prolipoprotein diacylglyceryl transferase
VRPAIVDALNAALGTSLAGWLVPSPAFLYVATITACLLVFVRRIDGAPGLSPYHAWGAALWAMAGGLVGARAAYLLGRPGLVVAEPGVLLDLTGGTMSWGAYIGGAIAFAAYLGRHGEPTLRYADAAASCLGLGPFIGRFACFLNGDDFGTVTAVPWAVTFPYGSFPHQAHLAAGWAEPMSTASLPVHPVQLYLAAVGLALFAAGTLLWRRTMLPAGLLFCCYWAADGAARFGLEFLRDPSGRALLLGMPDGQAIALIVAAADVAGAAMLLASSGGGLHRRIGRPAGDPDVGEVYFHVRRSTPARWRA